MTIKDILDYGTTGVLAVGVWALWIRLNTITDRLFTLLEAAAVERAAIAKSQGLDTQQMKKFREDANLE